jgi:hypothetical protein
MPPLAPRKKRFFDGMDMEQQRSLSTLASHAFESDDGTDLQELAAKAYLLGYREAVVQFSQPAKKTQIV